MKVKYDQTCVVQKVFNTSGSYSFAELIVLWPFNIQNYVIYSSIRNWIAHANEANIVNKDSPIQATYFSLFQFFFPVCILHADIFGKVRSSTNLQDTLEMRIVIFLFNKSR